MTAQIQPECLNKLIERNAVKIIDGSWALDGTDVQAMYRREHIPGAQFFDLEAVSDRGNPLPHMAPTLQVFAEAVGRMGISASDHVVIYDRQGLFSAARVWWTFTLMGHDQVQVLRGGLPAWKAAGFPISGEVTTSVTTDYVPQPVAHKIIDMKVLQDNLNNPSYLILDARPKARFEAISPEPRAGLRSGHMPGSQSLPFGELIRDGVLKPREELDVIFNTFGMTPDRTVVTTCGSGVTAAIISMALNEVGHTQALLYDGSWAEWGQVSLATPVIP